MIHADSKCREHFSARMSTRTTVSDEIVNNLAKYHMDRLFCEWGRYKEARVASQTTVGDAATKKTKLEAPHKHMLSSRGSQSAGQASATFAASTEAISSSPASTMDRKRRAESAVENGSAPSFCFSHAFELVLGPLVDEGRFNGKSMLAQLPQRTCQGPDSDPFARPSWQGVEEAAELAAILPPHALRVERANRRIEAQREVQRIFTRLHGPWRDKQRRAVKNEIQELARKTESVGVFRFPVSSERVNHDLYPTWKAVGYDNPTDVQVMDLFSDEEERSAHKSSFLRAFPEFVGKSLIVGDAGAYLYCCC